MPTYVMGYFKLTKELCNELNAMVQNFWWGSNASQKKIHWLVRNKMCSPKQSKGIGFRDIEAYNLALLAKQCWRLLNNESSLLFLLLKVKYFNKSSLVGVRVHSTASFTWKSLMASKEVLMERLAWWFGDWRKISIRHDKWLPSQS